MTNQSGYQAILPTPIKNLYLAIVADVVKSVVVRIDILNGPHTPFDSAEPFVAEVVSQVNRYFDDASNVFTVKVATQGTVYQRKVWHALTTIPVGNTMTYGRLAAQLASAPRALGGACRANPVPVIVPCHRVVSRQSLGGYAGDTDGVLLEFKRWLITHESRNAH